MFTYLKAKNFKSLKDITMNLKHTKTDTKKFIAIYGENGSGKTNIASAFYFLHQSVTARVNTIMLSQLPEEYSKITEKLRNEEIMPFTILTKFNSYRMIGEEEATQLEYGFKIDDIEGYYSLKFKAEIEEEKLYYMIDSKRGVLFEIKNEDGQIKKALNPQIFKNKKYREELEEEIDKYWGKISFMAIMLYEYATKNNNFIKQNVSVHFSKVINEFYNMKIHVDKKMNQIFPENIFMNHTLKMIEEGNLDTRKRKILRQYEKILQIFFSQAYTDIKDIYYQIEEKDHKIQYELYFKKMIAGKIRDISYKNESEGTKRVLSEINMLLAAINGDIVVIDEIDNGIHDLLMKNIINSLKDEIKGQLIITTHNTLLLEFLKKEELYVIRSDYNGNKEINCLNEYDIKIQKNHNPRDLYLKGLFGGIPMGDYIDFEEIKAIVYNINKEEELIDASE